MVILVHVLFRVLPRLFFTPSFQDSNTVVCQMAFANESHFSRHFSSKLFTKNRLIILKLHLMRILFYDNIISKKDLKYQVFFSFFNIPVLIKMLFFYFFLSQWFLSLVVPKTYISVVNDDDFFVSLYVFFPIILTS